MDFSVDGLSIVEASNSIPSLLQCASWLFSVHRDFLTSHGCNHQTVLRQKGRRLLEGG